MPGGPLRVLPFSGRREAEQAAEKGPSTGTHLRWVPPCSRGAAPYVLSTPRASAGTHP